MAANTKIEWAKASWNPVTGCSPISEGCLNCYAARMAKRLAGRYGYPKDDPFKVTFHPDRLDQPLKFKKRSRVFVCSMGDLWHSDVGWENIDKVFEACHAFCEPGHIYLFLTKRIEAVWYYFNSPIYGKSDYRDAYLKNNIWLGVTAENQKRADERIPILLQIPAAVRFVSVEPMLGPIDFLQNGYLADHEWEKGVPGGINWVICGGETGPGARPMDPDWARNLRDQCKAANVPFFMKAMSNKEPIPDDLMIREYPMPDTDKED